MLPRAIASGHFDVLMVAFHMLHQGARRKVFAHSAPAGVATLIMFAVRLVFSQPGRLAATLRELADEGRIDRHLAAQPAPLGFLVEEGGARDVIDAAYRFCRHEPGADVILFGTGSVAHLHENLRSILAPPLEPAALAKLQAAFSHLEGVGLDAPGRG
jgi:aryl-alcohol dehydrogenase-like predicted oxidoreductase